MGVIEEIATERRRQIVEECFVEPHDDEHVDEELMNAALCYFEHARGIISTITISGKTRYDGLPAGWPWSDEWWKPKNPRRDLIRAGALCMAEQDRCLRLGLARQALPDQILSQVVSEIEWLDLATPPVAGSGAEG